MPQPVKIAPPSKLKRWLKYLGLSFASLLLLLASFIFFWWVKFVPPISATVVDAVTGKPLPGMHVCLQARVFDFGKVIVLREESTNTNNSGRFSFTSTTHELDFFQRWEGYTIKVTDPRVKDNFEQLCGGYVTLNYIDEHQKVVTKNGIPPYYFPVAMIEQSGWHSVAIGPNNRKVIFPLGAHIPLVPLLQSPEQCQSVRDSSLVGFCRVLNSSWAADTLRQASTPSENAGH
jgi:hypothetical protein